MDEGVGFRTEGMVVCVACCLLALCRPLLTVGLVARRLILLYVPKQTWIPMQARAERTVAYLGLVGPHASYGEGSASASNHTARNKGAPQDLKDSGKGP